MVVVMIVRPAPARDTAGCGAGVGIVACGAWKRMPEEKHAPPGGCQALRRNKAKDFSWMQLKPMRMPLRMTWGIQHRRARRMHCATGTQVAAKRLHPRTTACKVGAGSAQEDRMRAHSTLHPFVRESSPMAP